MINLQYIIKNIGKTSRFNSPENIHQSIHQTILASPGTGAEKQCAGRVDSGIRPI